MTSMTDAIAGALQKSTLHPAEPSGRTADRKITNRTGSDETSDLELGWKSLLEQLVLQSGNILDGSQAMERTPCESESGSSESGSQLGAVSRSEKSNEVDCLAVDGDQGLSASPFPSKDATRLIQEESEDSYPLSPMVTHRRFALSKQKDSPGTAPTPVPIARHRPHSSSILTSPLPERILGQQASPDQTAPQIPLVCGGTIQDAPECPVTAKRTVRGQGARISFSAGVDELDVPSVSPERKGAWRKVEGMAAPAALPCAKDGSVSDSGDRRIKQSALVASDLPSNVVASAPKSIEDAGETSQDRSSPKLSHLHWVDLSPGHPALTRSPEALARSRTRNTESDGLENGVQRSGLHTTVIGAGLNLSHSSARIVSNGTFGEPLLRTHQESQTYRTDSTPVLDMDVRDTQTRWVQVGTRHAEAGFHDPSLGWISVHAERDANGLHAVLIPSSNDAEKMLGAHLNGLNAHLVSDHIQISPVTMSTVHDNRLESGIGSGTEQRNGGNRDNNESGERHQNHAGKQVDEVPIFRSLWSRDDLNQHESAPPRVRASDWYGMHVSVVA